MASCCIALRYIEKYHLIYELKEPWTLRLNMESCPGTRLVHVLYCQFASQVARGHEKQIELWSLNFVWFSFLHQSIWFLHASSIFWFLLNQLLGGKNSFLVFGRPNNKTLNLMVNEVRSNAGHSWSWKTASQIWFKTQIGRALVELRSPASSHVLFKQCFREFFWVVLNFLMFLILDSFMGFRVPFSSCQSSWSLILNCQMFCFRPFSIRRFMFFWTQSHLAAAESAHQARLTPGYVLIGFAYWFRRFRRFRPGCGRFHFQSGGTLAAKQLWGQKDLEDLDGFAWQGDCVAL